MKVSVVIPVHGRNDMLRQAVGSALAQGDLVGEVVIVDDASPVPIEARTWTDRRVRVLRHEANRGAAAARNSGVVAARYDWIAFLDSDDAWHPQKIRRQASSAVGAGPAEAVVLATGWVWVGGGAMRALAPAPATSLDDFVRGCWFSPGSTALLSRATWDRVGPFDEKLSRLEDYEWFLRFGLAGGQVIINDQALVAIRRHRSTAPVQVTSAAARIADHYGGGAAGARLNAAQRRTMHAYLALERAAARYYQGGPGFLGDLADSWWQRPRLRLQVAPPPRAAHADETILALAASLAKERSAREGQDVPPAPPESPQAPLL